ncbi:MAG: helix-turn-helix domain-containing protein, partial [Planktothrix sp.]
TRQRSVEVSSAGLDLIRKKMTELGYSEETLAEVADLSLDTIKKNLFGKGKIDRKTVQAIAKALGIKPEHISEQFYRKPKRSKSQLSANLSLRQISEGLIKQHGEWLTTNSLMLSGGVRFRLDEIFVPLGVVERAEKPQYSIDNPTLPLSKQNNDDKVTPISYDDFFT